MLSFPKKKKKVGDFLIKTVYGIYKYFKIHPDEFSKIAL